MDTPLPPTTTTKKLRIICSYGGHIVPRPRTNSLCYAGGETRIVSLNTFTATTSASATTLASLTSHLSSNLSIPTPFSLKYQLPNHDLDSLVSLLTDDDLLIMIDELRRLSASTSSSSATSSRIRLFVFSPQTELKNKSSRDSVIHHPKTESWFFDALKSAKIMQKGRANCLVGFDNDSQSECGLDLFGNGIGSMAESMVLETSSSFGSTSSSASLTNLAPIKSNVEEGDNKVKLTSPESLASETGVSAATSCPQTGAYQDPAIHAELEIKGSDVSSGVQAFTPVMASPYALNPQFDQLQQQKVQYIQPDSPYIIPQNSPGLVPISSFYPVYHTQLHQQQLVQFQYQPNQPAPVYILPVAPTQGYNFAGYHGFIESPTLTSSQTPVQMNASYIPLQVAHIESTQTDASPNLASQVYNTASPEVAAPLIHVQYNESQQQSFGLNQKQHTVAYRESPKHSNEVDDDLARIQIYKSQPPPPSRPSQYQSMTNATAVLLSEALAQLHTDNLKQQIRTSQPQ